MNLTFQFSELVVSITDTIDLISPVVSNHHKLVAYISYCLAKQLGLPNGEQIKLEIAGSLHDIGGLTLKERLKPTEFEYKDLDFHAEKGYLLLNGLKPCLGIAQIIRYHHNSWVNGNCVGVNNEKIPFGSHVLNLADRVSVLIKEKDKNILNSVDEIREKIIKRKGAIFHPEIVDAFMEISKKDSFWLGTQYLCTPNFITQNNIIGFGDFSHSDFEDFMIFMSRLVDFKSRFTASHSSSVAACAEIIAKYVGFSESETKVIKYAGYIHDLGKLAIPTEILEKPGALSKEEFDLMRTHAYHTNRVLENVTAFETIRIWGALHHEKLNGKGYPFGLKGEEIPLGSRIIAVADIFTAIREKRPYRDPMTKENTINILIAMSNSREIDNNLVEIVKKNFDELDMVREKAHEDTLFEYEELNNQVEKYKNSRLDLGLL
ncbi:HD domain-containing protein [Clostridium sp. FP2]|uniref:HD-GYP domain-containing protein n=1 Tax=Clostridium TaxID=1485 RepID=UPI0013E94354|nr:MULTISPECIES: HD domain-containing phosphohydrolase [Clostridium]MBW9159715.1 HD domain-containing protein [Clostridium tagluense]MBZ9622190.1 HD domain-containing protein [Clostridium sp. FP2]WLC66499.1 HD domain-containing protein [Clostridium tagluense]